MIDIDFIAETVVSICSKLGNLSYLNSVDENKQKSMKRVEI
jgi:hypothetical protein